jgi:hypothetical protein
MIANDQLATDAGKDHNATSPESDDERDETAGEEPGME